MAHGGDARAMGNVIALEQWRAQRAPSADDVARHPSGRALRRDTEQRRETEQTRGDGREPDASKLALRMITRKDLTEYELRQALLRRDCEPSDVESAVDMARRDGYLDDYRVALQAAERAVRDKYWSNRTVRNALRARGVSETTMNEVFATLGDAGADDEYERALAVAAKASRHYEDLDIVVARRRLVGVLQRRGFGGSLVQHVIAEVLDPHRDSTM